MANPCSVSGFFKKLLITLWNILASLLVIAILFAVGLVGINIYVIASTTNNMWQASDLENKHADYILILGAGLDKEGKPSPMLAERLNKGQELYRLHAGEKVLLSGDTDHEYYDESKAMKSYLMEKDVPEEVLLTDKDGTSTFQSILRARDDYGAKNIVIVTQQYHLYRAVQIAESLGLTAYGVPSDASPQSGETAYGEREFWARIKDFTQTKINDMPPGLQNFFADLLKRSSYLVRDSYN